MRLRFGLVDGQARTLDMDEVHKSVEEEKQAQAARARAKQDPQ